MVKMLLKALSCSLLVIVIDVMVGQARIPSSQEVAKHLGVSSNNGSFKKFYGFVSKYKKHYKDNQTLVDRFNVFQNNLKVIKKLNEEELGTAVYGITQFADLTVDEFLEGSESDDPHNMYDMNDYGRPPGEDAKFPKKWMPTIKKPKVCDWRSAKPPVVTPIQDEKRAHKSQIFALVAAVESQYQLRKRRNKPAKFSEQEIWDCAQDEAPVFTSVKSDLESGLASGDVYKYTGKEGECIPNLEPKYHMDLDGIIPFGNSLAGIKKRETLEDFMARYVAQRGPIIASVNVGAHLMHYLHGVVQPTNGICGKNNKGLPNHYVEVVGFGQTEGKPTLPYWILKNSWGKDFDKEKAGNNGYWFIYRGANVCNIAYNPFAVKALPVEFHKRYKASGCPKDTILPLGKEKSKKTKQ